MVVSAWKFTLGSAVILNIGSRLLEEPKIVQANGAEVVMSPDSDWAMLLDDKNSTVKIRFTIVVNYTTDKEARWGILSHLAVRATAGLLALKIEVDGYTDRYATFAQCKATEFEPSMYIHGNTAKQARSYLLECSQLTLTGAS